MTFVYALLDPRDLQPFYVGKTEGEVATRLVQHVSVAALGRQTTPTIERIQGILASGGRPRVLVLEEYQDRERFWIERLGQRHALTNLIGR